MSVKALHQIPGVISRSAWKIAIDGKVLNDWVMANFWWHSSKKDNSGGHLVVEIGMPLTHTEESQLFARLMVEPGGHLVEFIHQKEQVAAPYYGEATKLPGFVFTISDARATLCKLLPMQLQGAEIEGLDARSDIPVIQVITFNAKLERGVQPMGLADSKNE